MELLKLLNDENVTEKELQTYKHRRAVRVIIFDEDSHVAVVHAEIYKYHELPGGGVEKEETLEEGAIREAKEEAGCDVQILKEVGIVKEYLTDRDLINETFCFIGKIKGDKCGLNLNQDEIDEGMTIKWVDIDEAIRLIDTNKRANDNVTYLQVKYTKVRDITFLEKAKALIKEVL